MKRLLEFLILGLAAFLLSQCGTKPEIMLGPDGKPVDKQGKHYNPYPPGTYAHFKAESDYPKTSKVWKNEELLAQTDPSNSRLVVDRGAQRAYFMKGTEIVMDYPISTGVSGRRTPAGTFSILSKTVDKSSNSYGTVYDAEGNRIAGKETPADVPEGGKFVGAPMNYWMRLTNDGIGHHVGVVRRYPASHGCIRGPSAIVPIVFGKVKVGTEVEVK